MKSCSSRSVLNELTRKQLIDLPTLIESTYTYTITVFHRRLEKQEIAIELFICQQRVQKLSFNYKTVF